MSARFGDSQTGHRLRRPAILVDDRHEIARGRDFVTVIARSWTPGAVHSRALCVQLGRERGLFGTSVDGKTQFVAPAVAVLDGNRIFAGGRSGSLKYEQLAHSALTVRRYGAGNTKG